MRELDFDVDALSVEQPHQKEPKEDKRYGKSERGVDRRSPRKEEIAEDPLLERDLVSCLRPGYSHHSKQAGEDAGEDEQRECVDTKDDERLRPPFHLLDVDQPIADRER